MNVKGEKYGDDVDISLRLTYLEVPVLAPQAASGKATTRGSKRIVIGAAIGDGAGVVVGEYLFGRYLDLPHGPDMLLGAVLAPAWEPSSPG